MTSRSIAMWCCCCSGPRWCNESPPIVENYAVELGGEGDIIHIQVDDLLLGVQRAASLVYADFARNYPPALEDPLEVLADIDTEHLSDPNRVAAHLDFGPLDSQARSRGRRVLDRFRGSPMRSRIP